MKRLRDDDSGRHPVPKADRTVILYVEDDEANSYVLQRRLSMDYELLLAHDDRTACEMMRKHQRAISCILMDIEIQGSVLDGLELTRLFRGRPPHTPLPAYAIGVPTTTVPIIYLTAYGSRFSDDQLIGTGANHLMSKPVDFARLSVLLSQIATKRGNQSGFVRT